MTRSLRRQRGSHHGVTQSTDGDFLERRPMESKTEEQTLGSRRHEEEGTVGTMVLLDGIARPRMKVARSRENWYITVSNYNDGV